MHSSRCKPLLASTAEFVATFMYHHIEHMHKWLHKNKKSSCNYHHFSGTPRLCMHPRSLHALFHACTFIKGEKPHDS